MNDRERVAAHEAGHCCACLVLGVPVRLVDTIGDGVRGGRVVHDLEVTDRDTAITRAKIILAGLVEGADSAADLPAWPLAAAP